MNLIIQSIHKAFPFDNLTGYFVQYKDMLTVTQNPMFSPLPCSVQLSTEVVSSFVK